MLRRLMKVLTFCLAPSISLIITQPLQPVNRRGQRAEAEGRGQRAEGERVERGQEGRGQGGESRKGVGLLMMLPSILPTSWHRPVSSRCCWAVM